MAFDSKSYDAIREKAWKHRSMSVAPEKQTKEDSKTMFSSLQQASEGESSSAGLRISMAQLSTGGDVPIDRPYLLINERRQSSSSKPFLSFDGKGKAVSTLLSVFRSPKDKAAGQSWRKRVEDLIVSLQKELDQTTQSIPKHNAAKKATLEEAKHQHSTITAWGQNVLYFEKNLSISFLPLQIILLGKLNVEPTVLSLAQASRPSSPTSSSSGSSESNDWRCRDQGPK
jgi:hypothetical protein